MSTVNEVLDAVVKDEANKQATIDALTKENADLKTQVADPAKVAAVAALPGVAEILNPPAPTPAA